MPLYYFDIEDFHGVHRDDTGVELPDLDTAVHEARRALADMSREMLSRGGSPDQRLRIVVRDHDQGPIRLALSFTTERGDGEN